MKHSSFKIYEPIGLIFNAVLTDNRQSRMDFSMLDLEKYCSKKQLQFKKIEVNLELVPTRAVVNRPIPWSRRWKILCSIETSSSHNPRMICLTPLALTMVMVSPSHHSFPSAEHQFDVIQDFPKVVPNKYELFKRDDFEWKY